MITEQHLKQSHNMTSKQYLKKYPGALLSCLQRGRNISNGHKYHHAFRRFMNLTRDMLLPFCQCGCGVQVLKYGKKYIHGHNRRGKLGWSKGLTKETDPCVAAQADKLRGRTKINDSSVAAQSAKMTGRTKHTHPGPAKQSAKLTGRTKDTHPYIARGAAKASAKLKGRTAKTHPYVAARADKMRGRRKETHPCCAARAEKMSAKWADPDFVENLPPGARGLESKHHMELKQQAQDMLETADFTIVPERWCVANKHNYVVDLWAIRNGRKVVIEVGGCPDEKLANLRKLYGDSNVFHIPYGDEEVALTELEKMCF